MRKLKVAVYKFSGCDGCQLQFLNMEEELLQLTDKVEFTMFYEAKRDNKPGPYDVAFVEGAISTPHEVDVVRKLREESDIVVAIGACATYGGIQALRNWANVEEFKRYVYPNPEWIEALKTAEPASAYIKVDYEIYGCPVSKEQLLLFINQLLRHKVPVLPADSLCNECKRKGNVCVIVAKGTPCLGPVTRAGCNAICPTYGRGCYGCYGPMIDPKPELLAEKFKELNLTSKEIALLLRQFTNWAKPFREVSRRYG